MHQWWSTTSRAGCQPKSTSHGTPLTLLYTNCELCSTALAPLTITAPPHTLATLLANVQLMKFALTGPMDPSRETAPPYVPVLPVDDVATVCTCTIIKVCVCMWRTHKLDVDKLRLYVALQHHRRHHVLAAYGACQAAGGLWAEGAQKPIGRGPDARQSKVLQMQLAVL